MPFPSRFPIPATLAAVAAPLLSAAASLPAARAGLAEDWAPAEVFAPAIGPDLKQGYVLRAETWSGELPVGQTKAIAHQLFKGNDYRFYVAAFAKGAKVSVHIYDSDGNLIDEDAWQRANDAGEPFAGAGARPRRTGTYYLMVKVESAPANIPRPEWGMAYAFK